MQQTCAFSKNCLVPTQNIFTFIELNTETGAVWYVQFGMDAAHRFRQFIGAAAISENLGASASLHVGRFALYPTQNIYTFLLLDLDTSAVWQVQWGSNSMMARIETQPQPQK